MVRLYTTSIILVQVCVGEGKDSFTSTGYDEFTDITDKDISALKHISLFALNFSYKDTTEGAVSGVGNESVTLYANNFENLSKHQKPHTWRKWMGFPPSIFLYKKPERKSCTKAVKL